MKNFQYVMKIYKYHENPKKGNNLTHLIIVELCNVLLADGMDEERGGEGKEWKEGSGCQDDRQVPGWRVGIQNRLTS